MEKRGSTYLYSNWQLPRRLWHGRCHRQLANGRERGTAFTKVAILLREAAGSTPARVAARRSRDHKGGDWLIPGARAATPGPRTLLDESVWFETNGSSTVGGPTVGPQTPAP